MEPIKKKIYDLLSYCDFLTEQQKQLFLQEKYDVYYLAAFTHRSYDFRSNYELFEFKGDPSLNMAVSSYISQRFPNVISTDWLTKLKQDIVSSKYFGKLSEDYGLFELLRISPRDREMMNKHEDSQKLAVLDDLFESVFGVIVHVSDDQYPKGIGHYITYTIIKTMLDGIDIKLDWIGFVKPITLIKEIYDSYPKEENIEWAKNSTYKIFRNRNGGDSYIARIYFPDIDRNPNSIAFGSSSNEKDALAKAITYAITKSGIFQNKLVIPNPYTIEKKNLKKEPQTVEPEEVSSIQIKMIPEFIEHTKKFMARMGLAKDQISYITRSNIEMLELYMCLFSSSSEQYIEKIYETTRYDSVSFINSLASEYVMAGVDMVNATVTEYILTERKKGYISEDAFAIVVPTNFKTFLAKSHEENRYKVFNVHALSHKRINETFSAYLFGLCKLMTKHIAPGFGYYVVSVWITKRFKKVDNSIDPNKQPTQTEKEYKGELIRAFTVLNWGSLNEQSGAIEYETERISEPGAKIEMFDHKIKIYGFPRGVRTLLGTGVARNKRLAEKQASEEAMQYLIERGLYTMKKKNIVEPQGYINNLKRTQQPVVQTKQKKGNAKSFKEPKDSKDLKNMSKRSQDIMSTVVTQPKTSGDCECYIRMTPQSPKKNTSNIKVMIF